MTRAGRMEVPPEPGCNRVVAGGGAVSHGGQSLIELADRRPSWIGAADPDEPAVRLREHGSNRAQLIGEPDGRAVPSNASLSARPS
jgi:hypothetical protein